MPPGRMTPVGMVDVSNLPGCPDGGELTFVETEYGSLGQGGSYEVWDCSLHGIVYLPLPD